MWTQARDTLIDSEDGHAGPLIVLGVQFVGAFAVNGEV